MSSRIRLRLQAGGVLAIAVAAAALVTGRGLLAAATPAESYVTSRPRTPGVALPVLFRAPRFDLPESRGGRVSSTSLSGKVWVGMFLYTRCTSVCPRMAGQLAQLERRLTEPMVRFVSFSVDPEHDPPEVLRAFAEHWRPDPRWLLLGPSRDELEDLARGLRVAVAPSGDDKDPILHSRLLTLVDGQGRVRAVYDSDDALAWQRLAVDARELAEALPGSVGATEAASGSLLQQYGCTGCHDRPEVAPPLGGGPGRSVRLASGEVVAADRGYLRQSIRNPTARMVAGYAPLMPRYEGVLSDDEIEALVEAIERLATQGPGAGGGPIQPAGGAAEDPVCGMAVSTVDPLLRLTLGERSYHFCSPSCRERFRREHGAALGALQPAVR